VEENNIYATHNSRPYVILKLTLFSVTNDNSKPQLEVTNALAGYPFINKGHL